jgi:hypothetical protein
VKDTGQLKAFWDYRELNKSFESLQSNWIEADNNNYGDPEREEGDLKKPERDAEAELETRPGENELITHYSAPTIEYETRQVGLTTGPKLSDCGYCMAPTSPHIRELKIPVSGDVWCIGFHKDKLLEYEDSARMALPKRGVRRTPKQINDYVDRVGEPELLNISDVAKDRKWTIYQVGGLRFSPHRTKHPHWRGQLTHYRDTKNKDRWFRAKEDEYGTPYGPESKESVEAAKGSIDAVWPPLYPRTSKREVVFLSPAERAKQLANKAKPIPCLPPTDELLEAFRLKLHSNGKPANDNQNHDGLPYDIDSRDQLQFGYAFGTTYPDVPEPFDDVTERKSVLSALNAGLSSQTRLVANMVVQTDETDTVAQNYADVGAAIGVSGSKRTLMRRGQKAVSDAAEEIGKVRQQLAA